jgi:predicted component of type VI protein secretion system
MALKVVVTMQGSDAPLAEFAFGKEARARGISVGAAADNDIVLEGLPARAGRIARDAEGYQFADAGQGDGFLHDGQAVVSGGRAPISPGSRIGLGQYEIRFERGEAPRRPEVDGGAVVVVTGTGESITLQEAAFRTLKDLSRYFLGEGNLATTQELERFAELLKLTLDVAMEWMGRALRGREEFKDQFSAPVTQIFSRTLNPVKQGLDISQIANFLLDWREERDIEQVRKSLREAFNDMARHQMGLLAGVQEFVHELQQKLDPEKIAGDAGGGLLAGSRRAWQRYEELYGQTFAESSKLFNELIYPSIRKGYIFSHEDFPGSVKPGGET